MADIKLFGLSGTTNPGDSFRLAIGTATATAKNITLGDFYNLIKIKISSKRSLAIPTSPSTSISISTHSTNVGITPGMTTFNSNFIFSSSYTPDAGIDFAFNDLTLESVVIGSKFIIWDSRTGGFSHATITSGTPFTFRADAIHDNSGIVSCNIIINTSIIS